MRTATRKTPRPSRDPRRIINRGITLEQGQIEALDRLARAERRSRSNVVRCAVDRYLADHKPTRD